ncbi:MAG: SpoVR family protein [Deltaproteobacteria bacterium]|nr:SpoVR family protein [Deltaproteobacteria bacterium]
MPLPAHLEKIRAQVERYARDFGLDFYDTIFESVSYDEMNMIAAYGGFPTRYPHWKFGMEYEHLAKSYSYGLSKIYELVINNDPSYAYLMVSNADVDQKMVMAHVYGHVDFFKNNFSFAHTSRKMMDTMANHGTRIRRYIDRYGVEKVEGFIDRVLSIENLVDRQAPFIKRRSEKAEKPERDVEVTDVPRLKTDREYMQRYINPDEFIEEQKKRIKEERERARRFPERPERDVMLFVLENAPLENWERDVMAMLRDEAYYFAPQGQTKVMNEGWASFWHTTIMTQKALEPSELIDYADRHAGTMGVQPGTINPYKLGLELFRDIEDRWNKGRFGKEWQECDSLARRKSWDTREGQGRKKIFEVRRHYNDVTFIDEFLTIDFVRDHKLFTYGFNEKTNNWEITDREFKAVKNKLLFSLTNFGQPVIQVVDGNFENRGELLLKHVYEGTPLRQDWMRDTLKSLHAMWTRPVGIVTRADDKVVLERFDGRDYKQTEIETEP